MREIDQAFTEWSFLGVRQMRNYLRLMGYSTGIKRIRRLMRLMGLMPIYRKPRTSIPNTEHIRYPYLLRDFVITRPNQVWCADITYIPMHKGFLYLVAVMRTGTAKKCCPGDFPTPWTLISASRPWKKPWRKTVTPLSSTLIRAVSSPVSRLPTFCGRTESVLSPRMAGTTSPAQRSGKSTGPGAERGVTPLHSMQPFANNCRLIAHVLAR